MKDTPAISRAMWEHHGIYLLSLMIAWNVPGYRLPDDNAWLSERFGCSLDEVKTYVRPVISRYFKKHGKWLLQKRLTKESKIVSELSDKARKSAKARWDKEKKHAKAIQEDSGRNAPIPIPIEEKEEAKASSKKSAAVHRESRLPDDFEPDAQAWRLAEELRYDMRESRQAFDNFLDYWRSVPGAKGRKLDWQATFRNWLRNNRNRKPNNGKAPGTSRSDAFAVLDAVVDEARRRETGGGEPDDETAAGELPGLWEDHAGLRRRHN